MRRLFQALAIGAAIAAAWHPQAARAAQAEPPLIVPVPDNLSWHDVLNTNTMQYAVIPHGKANILFVWGAVETGASVRFRAALDAAKPIEEIWLYSQGGDLDEGLEIGRMIHARKLATHVVKGQRCVSACNFIFMGGVIRYVDRGAQFVVHMFSDNEADDLREDVYSPPKNYAALLKKYASLDVDTLLDTLTTAYPKLEVTQKTYQAAVASVKQQNSVDLDDDVAVSLEAMKKLIADYNHDHPDAPIDERAVITKVTVDEDVKSIQMSSAQTAASIARFLTEMGMSLKFLTRFAEIHNEAPRPLTRDELREFNVMNTD